MLHSICKRAVDFSCCRQLFGGVRVDKLVVIINGSGGVGKDTVCDAAAAFWKTRNISSITPILRVAESAGWDGVKTPASRRFLSELKQSCTEFNDLPFRYCTEQLALLKQRQTDDTRPMAAMTGWQHLLRSWYGPLRQRTIKKRPCGSTGTFSIFRAGKDQRSTRPGSAGQRMPSSRGTAGGSSPSTLTRMNRPLDCARKQTPS